MQNYYTYTLKQAQNGFVDVDITMIVRSKASFSVVNYTLKMRWCNLSLKTLVGVIRHDPVACKIYRKIYTYPTSYNLFAIASNTQRFLEPRHDSNRSIYYSEKLNTDQNT